MEEVYALRRQLDSYFRGLIKEKERRVRLLENAQTFNFRSQLRTTPDGTVAAAARIYNNIVAPDL